MKRAINNILMFLVDSARFVYFLLNLVVTKSFSNSISKNCGGTVAVLANGPSLNEVMPCLTVDDEFKNIDFVAMNYFAFDNIFFSIKPKHYCLADPMFFKEDHRIDAVRKLFGILQNDVDWNLCIYVPHHFAGRFAQFSGITNEKISVIIVHCVDFRGYESFRNFFYRKGVSTPGIYNVTNLAIYAAINSGYSKIMLYGVDHTFFDIRVDEQNRLCSRATHFYDDGKLTYKPIINRKGEVEKVSQYLKFLAGLFKSHDHLSAYAKYMNVEIINCTFCSLIDSYIRK